MRYIAGNVSTVTSKLDGIVASVLKMCKEHFRNLCNKNMEFSGVRYYFDVQTSIEVKNMFSTHVRVPKTGETGFPCHHLFPLQKSCQTSRRATFILIGNHR